jgi:hypothetical protein
VIWGTTINIEDSMAMFRDFMINYVQEGDLEPFYPPYLDHVCKSAITLNFDL